jgi:hypothetical protein
MFGIVLIHLETVTSQTLAVTDFSFSILAATRWNMREPFQGYPRTVQPRKIRRQIFRPRELRVDVGSIGLCSVFSFMTHRTLNSTFLVPSPFQFYHRRLLRPQRQTKALGRSRGRERQLDSRQRAWTCVSLERRGEEGDAAVLRVHCQQESHIVPIRTQDLFHFTSGSRLTIAFASFAGNLLHELELVNRMLQPTVQLSAASDKWESQEIASRGNTLSVYGL